MARACGSYPQCHWFDSSYRHQKDTYSKLDDKLRNLATWRGFFFMLHEGRPNEEVKSSRKKTCLFPCPKLPEIFLAVKGLSKVKDGAQADRRGWLFVFPQKAFCFSATRAWPVGAKSLRKVARLFCGDSPCCAGGGGSMARRVRLAFFIPCLYD